MAMTRLRHDPFARETIVRTTKPNGFCSSCGSFRKIVYRYGIEADDKPGRQFWFQGWFCNSGCRDAYHGWSRHRTR